MGMMNTTEVERLAIVLADKLTDLGYLTAPIEVELVNGDPTTGTPWRLVWDSDSIEFPMSMALGFMGEIGTTEVEAIRTLRILISSLTMVDLERDHMREMLRIIAMMPEEQLGVWRMLARDKANPDDAIAAADAIVNPS